MKNLNSLINKKDQRRGFFSIEFAMLIVLILLALLAMQIYLKNAVCGRFRSAADSFGQGRQYEPGVTVADYQ